MPIESPEHVKRWKENSEWQKANAEHKRLSEQAKEQLIKGKVDNGVMKAKAAAKLEQRKIERKLNQVDKPALQRGYLDKLDAKNREKAARRLGIR